MALDLVLRETGSYSTSKNPDIRKLASPISPKPVIDLESGIYERVVSNTSENEGEAILQMIHDTYAEKNVKAAENAFVANDLAWTTGIFATEFLPDIVANYSNSPGGITEKAISVGLSSFFGLLGSGFLAIIPSRITELATRIVVDSVQKSNQHRDINAFLNSEGIGNWFKYLV